MGEITLNARNADLQDIVSILTEQRARRLDLVLTAAAFYSEGGNVVIADNELTRIIDEDGVTSTAGIYKPTAICDEMFGRRFGIPGNYLKVLREAGRPDIYDDNVNGWLQGFNYARKFDEQGEEYLPEAYEPYELKPDSRKHLLRLLRGDEGGLGVARAVLSPKYKFIDNLDVMLAVMDGIRAAGIDAKPGACDLSERRLFARFEAPEIAALAPKLLDGYRSPFDGPGGVKRAGDDRPGMRLKSEYGNWDVPAALAAAAREGKGYEPGKEPVVWAGLIVSNSDVGDGARTIAPQIRVRVCKNGLTLLAEADRKVHLGSEQEEGVVEWSAETQEKELQLISAQAKDAVKMFLSQEFLNTQVAEIESLAGAPIKTPEVTVKEVSKAAGFTVAEADGILAHFFRGGSITAGGVANAVTSFSQTIESPDRAAVLDRKALAVMKHAARIGA